MKRDVPLEKQIVREIAGKSYQDAERAEEGIIAGRGKRLSIKRFKTRQRNSCDRRRQQRRLADSASGASRFSDFCESLVMVNILESFSNLEKEV